jgi:TatD DNase family protein
MTEIYDTHAHLDFPALAGEVNQVVDRALRAGVTRIVTIGTTLESSARAVKLAAQFGTVYAAVGVHPGYADESPAEIRQSLRELARQPKVAAIGEIGLDFYRRPGETPPDVELEKQNRAKQYDLFQQQLEVAAEFGLNAVIHTRDSFRETMNIFKPYSRRVRGVFHCFVGTPAEAQEVLGLGSLVSFTGILTFKNAVNVREALLAVPEDGFMLETDCPFLAPVPYRGKRCEPAYVRETAEAAAKLTGRSIEQVSAATCQTARSFFRGLD